MRKSWMCINLDVLDTSMRVLGIDDDKLAAEVGVPVTMIKYIRRNLHVDQELRSRIAARLKLSVADLWVMAFSEMR